jgi:serine/threonine-protein kinase RsbW
VRRGTAATVRMSSMAPPSNRKDGRPRRVRMRMPSRREAVAPTVERILEAAEPVGFRADQRADLAVALGEALSNAAVHGNRLHPGYLVSVSVEVTPRKQVVVEVRDKGPGFDTERLEDPTEPSRILVPGGRGVFLMRRLVDEVEYDAPGNRVRLTKRRRARARRRRGASPPTSHEQS